MARLWLEDRWSQMTKTKVQTERCCKKKGNFNFSSKWLLITFNRGSFINDFMVLLWVFWRRGQKIVGHFSRQFYIFISLQQFLKKKFVNKSTWASNYGKAMKMS